MFDSSKARLMLLAMPIGKLASSPSLCPRGLVTTPLIPQIALFRELAVLDPMHGGKDMGAEMLVLLSNGFSRVYLC